VQSADASRNADLFASSSGILIKQPGSRSPGALHRSQFGGCRESHSSRSILPGRSCSACWNLLSTFPAHALRPRCRPRKPASDAWVMYCASAVKLAGWKGPARYPVPGMHRSHHDSCLRSHSLGRETGSSCNMRGRAMMWRRQRHHDRSQASASGANGGVGRTCFALDDHHGTYATPHEFADATR